MKKETNQTRLRSSTSQPQLPSSSSLSSRPDWDLSLRDYRQKLEKLPSSTSSPSSNIKLSKSINVEISSTMKDMERPLTAPEKELIPQHQVHNDHYGNSGLTISAEPRINYIEGQAELNVLKMILNRENILIQLYNIIKKVEKKFQPDIIGLFDLLRQASLEVVTAIENWRAIKVR